MSDGVPGSRGALEVGDLSMLLDPVRAVELLRESGIAATSVNHDYLRLKAGESALLGCTIRGADESGGPFTIAGYFRTFADDRAVTLAAKWESMKPSATVVGPGVRLLATRRSVLFLFPNDAQLRGLRFIEDPDKLKRILGGLAGVGDAGWRVQGRKSIVHPVRYKPERRFIARVDLALKHDSTGEKSTRQVFLRFFPDSRGAKLDAIARAFHGAAGGPPVPKPLGSLLAGRVFAEEAVAGIDLGAVIGAGRGPAQAVASALLRLHATKVPVPWTRTPATLVQAARAAVHALRSADGALAATLDSVLRVVEGHAFGPPPASTIHGDLHLHQVLVTDGGPVFVDFERVAIGDPLEDVGNFVAHLLSHAARATDAGTRGHIDAFRDAFLRTYLAGAPRRPGGDLLFFVACGLLELALLPFRRLEANWSAASRATLDLLSLARSIVGAVLP